MAFRTVALITAATMAFTACSVGTTSTAGPNAPRFSDDAIPLAKGIVDDTTKAVASGLTVTPDTRYAETGCQNRFGSPDNTSSTPYVVTIHLPPDADAIAFVHQVEQFWQRRGYETSGVIGTGVVEGGVDAGPPRVHASTRGFELSADVLEAVHEAHVGANTPCLPKRHQG